RPGPIAEEEDGDGQRREEEPSRTPRAATGYAHTPSMREQGEKEASRRLAGGTIRARPRIRNVATRCALGLGREIGSCASPTGARGQRSLVCPAVRGPVVDVADELRAVRMVEQLADREDLAGVEPVVIRHAQ